MRFVARVVYQIDHVVRIESLKNVSYPRKMAEEKAPNALVTLECVQEGKNKLRMRITSSGYRTGANCQCPRNIREAGAKYQVPASAIYLKAGRAGTYFYHIRGGIVRVADVDLANLHVFGADDEDQTCVVCMDIERAVIFVPCGHFCACAGCGKKLKDCPMCRGKIATTVRPDQVG